MREGEVCIGCGGGGSGGGGGGVCVCVGGGGGVGGGGEIINILYPWKSTDEYPITLLFILCNISTFFFFF